MSVSRCCLSLAFILVLFLPAWASGKPPRLDRHGDPLPPGAVARLGTTRLRLVPEANEVALSEDGKLVAAGTGYHGARIRVWEATTGRLVCEIELSGGSGLPRLLLSPDGRFIAAYQDKAVVLWETSTGKEVRRFGALTEGLDAMYFARDSKSLIVAERRGSELRWWDVHTGKLLRQLDLLRGRKPRLLKPRQPEEQLGSVSVSPDDRTVAYQLYKMTFSDWEALPEIVPCETSLFVLDLASGKQRRVLQRKASYPDFGFYPLHFSPDGKLLAVGIHGTIDGVLDVAGGKIVRRPRTWPNKVRSFAFSANGKVLATLPDEEWIEIHDTRTWKVIRRLPVGSRVDYLALSGNGSILAFRQGYRVCLWDIAAGRELPSPPGHQSMVYKLAFSTDSREVWSESADVLCRWDRATSKNHDRLRPPRDCCLRAGLRLTTEDDQRFQLLSLRTGRPVASFRLPPSKDKKESFFSEDGKVVGIGVEDDMGRYRVSLRKTASGKEFSRLVLKQRASRFASPDGRLLLWRSATDPLHIWDVSRGKQVCRIDPKDLEIDQLGRLIVIACSPDGRTCATAPFGQMARQFEGSQRARIRFWRVSTGQPITTSDRFPGYVPFSGLVFSPDGRMVATGDFYSPVVRLWEVATGKLRAELKGHEGGVHCVAFSPDGRWLASGSEDTTVLIWDLHALPHPAQRP